MEDNVRKNLENILNGNKTETEDGFIDDGIEDDTYMGTMNDDHLEDDDNYYQENDNDSDIHESIGNLTINKQMIQTKIKMTMDKIKTNKSFQKRCLFCLVFVMFLLIGSFLTRTKTDKDTGLPLCHENISLSSFEQSLIQAPLEEAEMYEEDIVINNGYLLIDEYDNAEYAIISVYNKDNDKGIQIITDFEEEEYGTAKYSLSSNVKKTFADAGIDIDIDDYKLYRMSKDEVKKWTKMEYAKN